MNDVEKKFIDIYSANRHEFIWTTLNPGIVLRSDGGIPVLASQIQFYKRADAIKNIDELKPFIEEGLIQVSEFTFREAPFDPQSKFVTVYNTYKTYKGKRLLLDSSGFKLSKWQARNERYICCDRAIPSECVCLIRTECDIHGARCNGTHD
jgi:hypothetical protein